jgi:hypothetical protein
MRQCNGCQTDIETEDGVTVLPARTQPDGSLSATEWWHPDCRQVELRKLASAGRTSRGAARRAPQAVPTARDEM